MAVQTLPLELEITCYSRTTLHREFRWLPDGVTPQDFTGWTALMLIGPAVAGTIATHEIAAGSGMTLTTDGRIIIDVPPSVTGMWPTGTARYTLDLTDTTGYCVRFLRGRFAVVHELDPLT